MDEITRNGVLLLAEIDRYNLISQQIGMIQTIAFDRAFAETVNDLAAEYQGELIRHTGETVLLFFPDEERFLDFAWALRELSQKRMLDSGDFFCNLRMSAHYGTFSMQYIDHCHAISDFTGPNSIAAFQPENLDHYIQPSDVIVTGILIYILSDSLKKRNIKTTPLGKKKQKKTTPKTVTGIYKLLFPDAILQ